MLLYLTLLGRIPTYMAMIVMMASVTLSLSYAQDNDFFDIEADSIYYNDTLQIITAVGNVVIANEAQSLKADKIIYHKNTKHLIAVNNVLFTEHDYTYHGDYLELDGDFKHIIIKKLYAHLGQNSQLWADKFTRNDGLVNALNNAKFTTCNACDDGSHLWRIGANDVVHDTEAKTIEYHHALIYLHDIPIFYVPYFRQPDPTVKRQSGIIDADFGSNPSLGAYTSLTHFETLGNHQDITLSVISTANYGFIPAAEYRQFFEGGELYAEGAYIPSANSNTNNGGTDFYTKLSTIQDINNEWRIGGQFQHQTRRDFYRTYSLFSAYNEYTHSNIYAEGFLDQHYARYEIKQYNDLRLGNEFQRTNVAPSLYIDGVGTPNAYGGRWRLEANARDVKQNLYGSQQAFHIDTGYTQPYVHDTGFIINSDIGVRTSTLNSQTNRTSQPSRTDSLIRLLPEANIVGSYPLSSYNDYGQTVLEPRASLYVSSFGGNNAQVFNIDTSRLELNTSNIFARKRLPGYSFIETGPRSAYGVELSHYFNNNRYMDIFLGQSQSYKEDIFLKNNLGVDNVSSDYLLDIRSELIENFIFNQYLVFNSHNGNVDRLRLNSYYTYDAVTIGANYTFFNAISTTDNKDIKQLQPYISANITPYISAGISSVQNYTYGVRKTLSVGSYLQYKDECFDARLTIDKSYTRASDIDNNGYSILLNFELIGL